MAFDNRNAESEAQKENASDNKLVEILDGATALGAQEEECSSQPPQPNRAAETERHAQTQSEGDAEGEEQAQQGSEQQRVKSGAGAYQLRRAPRARRDDQYEYY